MAGRKVFVYLLLAVACFSLQMQIAHAKAERSPVFLLIVNYLSLDDLTSAGPNIRELIGKSAIGLANTGLNSSKTEANYLSIGAGTRINGSGGIAMFYGTSELVDGQLAGVTYKHQTGMEPPSGGAVCLGLSGILRANKHPVFRIETLGLLGESFHRNNLRTSVIGNCDTSEQLNRKTAFVAMDESGTVDFASLGDEVLVMDQDNPAGVRDNLKVISLLASKRLSDSGLVVVELGDLSRLESLRRLLSESAYSKYRTLSLRRMDSFVRTIVPEIERRNATLVICSPCRVADKHLKSNLTPVILYKAGNGPGLLTSATTQTDGLISNIDLGPTLLTSAGLDVPMHVLGRPVDVTPSNKTVEALNQMEQIATRNYAQRVLVLALIAILAILSATVSELIARRERSVIHKIISLCLLIILAMPSSLLLISRVNTSNLAIFLLLMIVTAAVILGISLIIKRIISTWINPRTGLLLGVLYALTSLLILGDTLTGNHLLRWSIISCNQIVGIRYYGLGNEYMGILISMSLMAVMLLFQPARKDANLQLHQENSSGKLLSLPSIIPLILLFSGIPFVIGFPGFGANIGGLLMGIATFSMALCAINGIRFKTSYAVIVGLSAFALLVVFAVVDLMYPASKVSHLGRSISLAQIYGSKYIWNLVSRKLVMHVGIISMPQAYCPILFSIPFFIMYGRRIKHEGQSTTYSYALYKNSMPAVVTGMITGFLLNDSGIVPAGLLFSTFMISVLYLRLSEVKA